MALEILKEGNVPGQSMYGECCHCGCQVKCDRMDAYSDMNKNYFREKRRYDYYDVDKNGFVIQCPTPGCSYSITLSEKQECTG